MLKFPVHFTLVYCTLGHISSFYLKSHISSILYDMQVYTVHKKLTEFAIIYNVYRLIYWFVHGLTVADSERFLRGGALTNLRGARSSHASVIPYIINQIFPTKGGSDPPAPPGSAYVWSNSSILI